MSTDSSTAGTGSVPDRGPVFDGIRIGRPATGALIDAGHRTVADLPADLDALLTLHGVGPAAVRRLREARDG
ncbi:helix-hairpin-helix domain-containing protein [Propionibacteriaceae bacterium Y1685]|uniref:helix-hairpin-helix domain-containing protein n=1 Tax=Microlunatus sp. Y1700 TaxID=3418487 RepID=UPI003B77B9B1